MRELKTIFPFFTDETRGYPYLNQILKDIREDDTIVIEGYLETKEELEHFLTTKEESFESFEQDSMQKLREINKEVGPISPSFRYIVKTIQGQEFKELRVLESYKESYNLTKEGHNHKNMRQRNELMYPRLGKIIDESNNRVISFIALGHSLPIRLNINTGNTLDLNQYTEATFKEIKKIQEKSFSFEITYLK